MATSDRSAPAPRERLSRMKKPSAGDGTADPPNISTATGETQELASNRSGFETDAPRIDVEIWRPDHVVIMAFRCGVFAEGRALPARNAAETSRRITELSRSGDKYTMTVSHLERGKGRARHCISVNCWCRVEVRVPRCLDIDWLTAREMETSWLLLPVSKVNNSHDGWTCRSHPPRPSDRGQ
jgi:hypothetical protein